MKTRRFLLFVCMLALLVTSLAVPTFALSPPPVGHTYDLTLENEETGTKMLLYWEEVDNATFYEIYRSTTGSEGNFDLLATTDQTTYHDTGLKPGTQYCYRVRGGAELDEDVVFGSYSLTAEAFTGITADFVKKKLRKAYKVADAWMSPALTNCDTSTRIRIKHKDYYSKEKVTDDYCPVTSKTITTKKKLKKFLYKYFERSIVNNFVSMAYYEKSGQLYMIDRFDENSAYAKLNDDHLKESDIVRFIRNRYSYYDVLVSETYRDIEGNYSEYHYLHGFLNQNGYWVFGEPRGIALYGKTNHWDYLWNDYYAKL